MNTKALPDCLESLRGVFEFGMTDEDVDRVCGVLEECLGRRIACIWDFDDFWGLGGDNCLYEIHVDGFFEIPEMLSDFLYEPDSAVSPKSLLEVMSAEETPEREPPSWAEDLSPVLVTKYNYALRQSKDEELD